MNLLWKATEKSSAGIKLDLDMDLLLKIFSQILKRRKKIKWI